MLQIDNMNADAIYVRGLCLYYEDNVERAFSHFTQVFSNINWCSIHSFFSLAKVLRFAPDHVKAKEIYRVCKIMPLELQY